LNTTLNSFLNTDAYGVPTIDARLEETNLGFWKIWGFQTSDKIYKMRKWTTHYKKGKEISQ